uniref:Histone-lysine N-methyltransferase, H3 lysine-79 specific n=1 Tax=Strongyloides venezuelensis TaxID=75913 RepID=A0A0K0G1U2_STRVS
MSSKEPTNELQKKSGDELDGGPPKTEKKLKLSSPYGGESLYYFWNYEEKYKNKNKAIVVEIVDLVRITKHKIKEINDVLKQHGHDVKSIEPYYNLDNLRILCRTFNKAVKQIGETYHGMAKADSKLGNSSEQFQEIINRVYNKAVVDVNALNKHYGAFSSETYGETTWKRMATIVDELKLTEKDVFVDLGSGVGQIVCQVAGSSKVGKAIGIEIADLPAKYARRMEFEFSRLMRWHNRTFRQFKLYHGNFLDMKYRKLITEEATVIFINNYAFHEKLNMEIKRHLLHDLKDGVRVISTKPFVIHKEITERTLNDVSSIMEITEFKPVNCPASWTNKHVPYYLQTVNRDRLLEYFNKQKRARDLREMKESRASRGSSVSSTRVDGIGDRKDSMDSKDSAKHKENKNINKVEGSDRKNVKDLGDERKLSKDVSKKNKETVARTHSTGSSHDSKDEKECKDTSSGIKDPSTSESLKENNSGKEQIKRPSIEDDTEIIYGATTRKKWKAIIGEMSEKEKPSHSSSTSTIPTNNNNQETMTSTNDPEMKKKSGTLDNNKEKPKVKHGQRGRPKKVVPTAVANDEVTARSESKVDVKITQEDKEALELMEKLGEEAVEKVSHEKFNNDSSVVETPIHIDEQNITMETDDEQETNKDEVMQEVHDNDVMMEDITNIEYVPSKDPLILQSVDMVLEEQRQEILKFIDFMYSDDFKKQTEIRISKQRQLRESKVQKINALKAMITLQQEEGKQLLTTRIKEVGIDAKTAPEFIDAAKLIVETNKVKQKRLANLEREIAAAEKTYEEYQARINAKDAHEKSITDVINSVANENNVEDSIDSIINSVANNSLPSSNSDSYCNTPTPSVDILTQRRNVRGKSVIRSAGAKKVGGNKKNTTDKNMPDTIDVESQVENILKKIQNQSKEQESLKSQQRLKSDTKKRYNTSTTSTSTTTQVSSSINPVPIKKKRSNGGGNNLLVSKSPQSNVNLENSVNNSIINQQPSSTNNNSNEGISV